ncbi:MAG TPA: prenyltransferase/squalene oxidase repeat-containing protein [Verrucomicrobiae bacterium]|nr:prenyltransferase/squalene oxidase repeat-containing protein [Verrucomicrobiae bacterium]
MISKEIHSSQSAGFLGQLDARLREGWQSLAPTLRDSVLAWLEPFADAHGGYRGRRGSADTYYTDFGVRLLDLADAPADGFGRVDRYLRSLRRATDLVDLFSRLNAVRLLRRREIAMPWPENAGEVLRAQRAEGGGFAQPGRREPSAYLTFLAALACEITGDAFPEPASAAAAVRALRRPGGGFADRPGEALAQASTTAAAIAALGLIGAADARETEEAARFLVGLQGPDGGIRAHMDAPGADLLSTFTALTCLAGVRALNVVRLASVGRFILDLRTQGGFCGSMADPECDIEYTYYGIGGLCLLQAHLNGRRE